MSFTSEFIKGYMRGIHIAYLVLQLISIIVLMYITIWIVYTYGKPDRSFSIAMNIWFVLTLLVFGSKMIYQLYEDHKGN